MRDAVPRLSDNFAQAMFLVPEGGVSWRDGYAYSTALKRWVKLRVLVGRHDNAVDQMLLLDENPDLMQRFLLINGSEKGIQKFANRFGWLGVGEHFHAEPRPDASTFVGESFASWQIEMARLHAVVDVLLHLKQNPSGLKLRKLIRWGKAGVCYLDDKGMYAEIASNDGTNKELLGIWKPGDVLGPARHFLIQQTSKHLRPVSPAVWLVENQFRPILGPTTLISAIWLQFLMEELCGKGRILRCAGKSRAAHFFVAIRSKKTVCGRCLAAERQKRRRVRQRNG
jgi:hypothetical protein